LRHITAHARYLTNDIMSLFVDDIISLFVSRRCVYE